MFVKFVYPRKGCLDTSLLVYTTDQKVLAAKKIPKNSLKIFPFGLLVPIKAGEEKGKRSHGPSSKLVIAALKTKNQYQLVPSKVDFDKGTGASSLPTYFWIAGVPKEEDANMELAEWKLEGLVAIPYMKPKQQNPGRYPADLLHQACW